jgi:hypothetical protein
MANPKSHLPRQQFLRTRAHVGAIARLAAMLAGMTICLAPAAWAWAQDKAAPPKAAGVFDDDSKQGDTKKKAADSQKAAVKPVVSDRDSIGFTQENVSAQMNELEERMFRLAEALRSLEPENASRLRLALKFSREELILQQMKETQKLLKEAQLSKAETEARELLAKLEHLRQLLLAEDLDFQMKLARLRQMRETMTQLERIIKEERRELAWSNSAIKQKQELKEFQRFEQDQSRNRKSTDTLAEVAARIGDTGVSVQKDLIRASGSMKTAEGDLAKTAAKPAADDQTDALKHLVKSRNDLAKAMENLLVELRSELQSRIIAELTEMHDIQASIRETTESQAARVAQKSRTALLTVTGLSPKEGELGERTEHLLALVEETEFGIALPTSLRVLSREMRTIQSWLKDGDASPRTITLEKRVEDDLLGLLVAMRRLPPTTPPPPGTPLPTDLRARERELNRLVAELKMIRLLQSRLNDDTLDVDKTRPGAPPLTAELRHQIEALKASQDEIKASLGKISLQLEAQQDEGESNDPNKVINE